MKKYWFVTLIFVLFFYSSYCQQKQNKPNIIIILADDLGWADLSCYGSSFYETPRLDELAQKGTKFTQNYTSSPVCSPTRASLLTGKNPIKTGITDWIKGRQANGKAQPYEKLIAQPTAYQLALEEKTIAEIALENGYKTMLSGKWHLGEEEKYWPENHGFQTNIGGWSVGSPKGRINDTTGGFFTPYQNPKLTDGPRGEYLTDRLTSECINFIENNKEKPFFLLYSLYAVHNPLQAPTHLVNKYKAKQQQLNISPNNRFIKDEAWMKNEANWKRRLIQDHATYAAMIENMDWNIGKILDKLNELNIADNTIIIFTSDNGGLSTAEGSPTTNGLLRNGKGWLHEGGIRVPLIMYWKNKTTTAHTSNLPVISTDLFVTVGNAINKNSTPKINIEGSDIFQLMKDSLKQNNRILFWYYPHYSNQGGKPSAAVRKGNFKLIYNLEDSAVELYNLQKDISEKNNLVETEIAKTKELKKILFDWLKKNKATYPTLNPTYKHDTSIGN